MSSKFHIGENGPAPCSAKAGNCPYGSEEHFDTQEKAQEAFQERAEQAYQNKPLSKGKKEQLTPKEKTLLAGNVETLKKFVEARAELGDVTYEDANPERAERRLKEALDFAESRNNTHLAGKLRTARVLPSGAFKTADGKRVNTDKLHQNNLAIKHVEEERGKIIAAVQGVIDEKGTTENKASLKTEHGSFSMSVSDSIDQEEFDKLPAKMRVACSVPKESLSLDQARNELDAKTLHEITTKSQVIDYISGKKPDFGQESVKANTDNVTSVENGHEAMQKGLVEMSALYGSSTKQWGKTRDLKANFQEGNNAIKGVAAKHDGNTFAPARSQLNGALVTERLSVNKKKAEELLSKEQLKKISVTKMVPDAAKARTVMGSETFDKIFGKQKVSVRVVEAKD